MDITADVIGCAHLSDWEQECCGEPTLVGAVHELIMRPAVQGSGSWPPITVDWTLTHHDDGGPAESTALRRVRALVRSVHEVWPGECLSEVDRVPGREELVDPEPGEETPAGVGSVVVAGACEPVLSETPRPEAWILELEILEDLGLHSW